MEIGTPLKRLEIIGTDDTSILKANHSTMLNKGSKEYILSVREEILKNRGFKIPEDWDTEWDANLGPIWTPAELGDAIVCWLSPEYLHPLSTDDDIVAQADDRSGNGVVWENTHTSGTLPTFTSELNGFKGMSFANDWLYSLDESGDGELDPGTGGFAISMLISHGAIGTAERYILCTDNSRDFALSVKEVSGVDRYKVYFNGSATESATTVDVSGDPFILTVGRKSGNQFLKTSAVSIDDTAITGSQVIDIDDSQQFFIGAREHVSSDRYAVAGFTGEIYEIIFYHGNLSTDDMEKIEGYLAHKYAQTAALHTGSPAHPYKTNPPRAGVPA
tara:strand:- start:8926 stop:9921 length:996 start_codon:yes stop_codon:yes gene_type:complete